MTPASVRRVMLRDGARRERVQRVVDFMNQKVGYGWARRMEKRDRWLDQDYPRVWLNGKKRVSVRNLLRFEQYAARFGYQSPAELTLTPRIQTDLLNMLNKVNSGTMLEALENISGPSQLNQIDPSTQGPDVPSI